MKKEKIKKDIEKFFADKCFVWEWEEQKREWGETVIVQKKEKIPLYGRLITTPKIVTENGVLPKKIEYDAILLFSKENRILPGSVIEIEQKSEAALLFDSVGEMVCYDTHHEIALKRKGTV